MGEPPEGSPDAQTLVRFRRGLHGCLARWDDALFELGDAMLGAPGPVSSVPSLSLEPEFRRSHGSLYKALAHGRIDGDALRRLLVAHRPARSPLVFAVDASTWARCDAECSPERGFYYSASRHSAGQPIVAGWSYQWIAQLDWAPDSWTAPLDVMRIQPTADATTMTTQQVQRLVALLPADGLAPVFVFDAGYDPIALSVGLADSHAAVLVRIRSDRVVYADPAPCSAGTVGRPRRHGARFALTTPATPTPDASLTVDHPRYGTVRVTAWHGMHPRLHRRGRWAGPGLPADRARHCAAGGGGASAEAQRTRQEDPLAVVVRHGRTRSRRLLARLPAPVRPRAHFPLHQVHARLDHPRGLPPATGRPLDLADRRRLYAAAACSRPRRRPPAAMGAPPRPRQTHPCQGAPGFPSTGRYPRHAGQCTETQQGRPRTSRRHPQTSSNPLSGSQERRLSASPGFNRKLRACRSSS